jgi:hypothetical protein
MHRLMHSYCTNLTISFFNIRCFIGALFEFLSLQIIIKQYFTLQIHLCIKSIPSRARERYEHTSCLYHKY